MLIRVSSSTDTGTALHSEQEERMTQDMRDCGVEVILQTTAIGPSGAAGASCNGDTASKGPPEPRPQSSTLHGKSTWTPGAGFSTEEEEGHKPMSECPTNNRPEQKGFKMVSNEDDTVPIEVATAGNSFTCGLYTKSVIPLSPLTSIGPMLM